MEIKLLSLGPMGEKADTFESKNEDGGEVGQDANHYSEVVMESLKLLLPNKKVQLVL